MALLALQIGAFLRLRSHLAIQPTPIVKPPSLYDLGVLLIFRLSCRDPDLNWGHGDFQSPALPTELSRLIHSLL